MRDSHIGQGRELGRIDHSTRSLGSIRAAAVLRQHWNGENSTIAAHSVLMAGTKSPAAISGPLVNELATPFRGPPS